ncbi:hypothetical protein AB0N61_06080 [Microbacterium sp. NPDC089320]|uniref:hypothetical protein n=1 Tax=Microbacterium sp. NPDC089320 TaxID=3155182 RepID=UPI00343D5D32
MDEATIEPAMDARLDSARPRCSVPSQGPARAPVIPAAAMADPMTSWKPGSIGVRYRLKRRFRTCDAIACVPVPLAQTRIAETVASDDGARIHGGLTYVPMMRDGAPVSASDENLDAVIRAAVPSRVMLAEHPAAAERELHAAMRPALDRYLLIDGEIWSLA